VLVSTQIDVTWSEEALARFPQLALCIGTITGIHNQKENDQLRQLKKTVYEEAKGRHNLEALKNDSTVRAYRDFYWRLDIDPTKTRPSGEALLRRVLNGNELPNISTVVDAYNLASMQTIIPVSGFDMDNLNPPLHVRFAKSETFTGIGMERPVQLIEKMLVLTDEKQVLSVYPYRDSDNTKITLRTRNVLIIGYGAPGIGQAQLRETVERTLDYVQIVSGGQVKAVEVFGRLS